MWGFGNLPFNLFEDKTQSVSWGCHYISGFDAKRLSQTWSWGEHAFFYSCTAWKSKTHDVENLLCLSLRTLVKRIVYSETFSRQPWCCCALQRNITTLCNVQWPMPNDGTLVGRSDSGLFVVTLLSCSFLCCGRISHHAARRRRLALAPCPAACSNAICSVSHSSVCQKVCVYMKHSFGSVHLTRRICYIHLAVTFH